jgi:CRISPR-associated protein Csx10
VARSADHEDGERVITFEITFRSSFHVATGLAAEGRHRLVDTTVPLPASSLKGRMRAEALTQLGVDRPLVDAIFGTAATPSPWAWTDATLIEPTVKQAARIQILDHGRIKPHSLLLGEHVWSQKATFKVRQVAGIHDHDRPDHELVLRASARSITSLGGERRRGAGWVTILDLGDEWTESDTDRLIACRSAWKPSPPTEHPSAAPAVGPRNRRQSVTLLHYTIWATQRIAAGTRAETGNVRDSHSILPGSVVRGSLATAWLRDHNLIVADERFADLFERDITIRPARPRAAKLVPLSLVWCKYPNEGCPHGIQDLASQHIVAPRSCDDAPAYGRGWLTDDVPKVSSTRTKLTADAVAATGQLFTRSALSPDVLLRGDIRLATADADIVEWLTTTRDISVGGQRSTLGHASWSAHALAAPVVDATPEPHEITVLRLISPAILVDEYGAPTTDPTFALQRLLGPDVSVPSHWTRPAEVTGWHTPSGLPKPVEWAAEAGSTYLLRGVPADAAARIADGLGLRCAEGYGEVELVAPSALDAWSPNCDQLWTCPDCVAPPPIQHVTVPTGSDVLDRIADALPGPDYARTLRGVAASLHRMNAVHGPPPARAAIAAAELEKPWARDLPDEIRAELRAMLLGTDLPSWRVLIASRLRELP